MKKAKILISTVLLSLTTLVFADDTIYWFTSRDQAAVYCPTPISNKNDIPNAVTTSFYFTPSVPPIRIQPRPAGFITATFIDKSGNKLLFKSNGASYPINGEKLDPETYTLNVNDIEYRVRSDGRWGYKRSSQTVCYYEYAADNHVKPAPIELSYDYNGER